MTHSTLDRTPMSSPYQKAPLGRRFAASLLDGLIAFAGLLLLGGWFAWRAANADEGALSASLLLGFLAALVWALWYTHAKDGLDEGQSWGKRALDLMVVHLPTDLPCSMWQSTVRKLIWDGLCVIPLVGPLVEPATAVFHPEGRRLGDRVADTQVVRVEEYERRRMG
ncbi:RDD family protein [Roseisolibacter agri]|uniref:RDD domain-containing protein n=1 Tax=Roseisolibacter agri TaxID=2014610 RepID=A0AA37V8K1_9BACT|nr:RDD family protein [Roseisolibacter agri]GLC23518.1 hypothetical protein rosag_00310 [Roseisolibacter agri]